MAEFSSTGVQSAGDLASSDEFWTSNELPSVLATRLRESLNSIQEVEAEEQSGSGAAVSSPRAIGSSPLSPRSAAIRSPRPSLPDASSTFRADDRARKYTYRASTHMTQEQLAAMFQHEHGHGHEMLQSPVDSEFERNLSFDINDSSDIRLYGRRSLALKRSIEMAVGGLGGPSEDPAPRRPTAKRGRTATVVSWIRASRSPDNEAQMPRSTVGKQRQNAAAFITDVEPVALTFENLTFKLDRSIFSRVASHVPGLRRFATPEKYLLSNVSGHIEPGSLIALIGPSGAGKSTLLGLLSGKIQADNLKGVMELSNSTHVVDIRNRPVRFPRFCAARPFAPLPCWLQPDNREFSIVVVRNLAIGKSLRIGMHRFCVPRRRPLPQLDSPSMFAFVAFLRWHSARSCGTTALTTLGATHSP